jgi:hypothetical protein
MRSGKYALVPAMKVSVTFSIGSGTPKMLLSGMVNFRNSVTLIVEGGAAATVSN